MARGANARVEKLRRLANMLRYGGGRTCVVGRVGQVGRVGLRRQRRGVKNMGDAASRRVTSDGSYDAETRRDAASPTSHGATAPPRFTAHSRRLSARLKSSRSRSSAIDCGRAILFCSKSRARRIGGAERRPFGGAAAGASRIGVSFQRRKGGSETRVSASAALSWNRGCSKFSGIPGHLPPTADHRPPAADSSSSTMARAARAVAPGSPSAARTSARPFFCSARAAGSETSFTSSSHTACGVSPS